MLFSGLLIYPWKEYLIIFQWKLSKYNFTLFNDVTTFFRFSQCGTCWQFWQCQAVQRKAKLEFMNDLNIKSNKKRKFTSIYSNYQSPNLVPYFFGFIFTVWKIHSFPMQKCLDGIWAYLSILQAITAVCFMKTRTAMSQP
jgi:hypothetical protein